MKWFKHDSDASIDAKLTRARAKYGMEGYGLYWFCLELIARTVEKHNLTFELEHDAELIALETGIHQERVQEMMLDFVKWRLFENADGRITCLKMATRTDEYTQKLIRNQGLSRHSPDTLPIKSDLIEEKRREEKRYTEGDMATAKSIFQSIQEMNPKHKKPNFNTWANTVRLMKERDGHSHKEILDLFRWANNDDFWRKNILSPTTLRKQWDKLTIQSSQNKTPASNDYVM